jgi:hypothetical protein
MPLHLYTTCQVSAPCGVCSPQRIIGLLHVPDLFVDLAAARSGRRTSRSPTWTWRPIVQSACASASVRTPIIQRHQHFRPWLGNHDQDILMRLLLAG